MRGRSENFQSFRMGEGGLPYGGNFQSGGFYPSEYNDVLAEKALDRSLPYDLRA